VVAIDDSYTFVPEDQPAWLSDRILDFLRATTQPRHSVTVTE
jgi:hypothetical protein